ncbi:hypothetical protein ACLM5H_18290 [Fredinandcohnia humi]
MEKDNTIAKITIYCILYGMIVCLNSVIIIYSPYVFIRVLNLIVVIIISSVIGSFIREIFIINNGKKQKQQE